MGTLQIVSAIVCLYSSMAFIVLSFAILLNKKINGKKIVDWVYFFAFREWTKKAPPTGEASH